MDLATRVDRIDGYLVELTATLGQLAAAQSRTEERMGELAAAQRDLAAAQARTEAEIQRLVETQTRSEQHLAALRTWQTGESGRRDGERYEQSVIRHGLRASPRVGIPSPDTHTHRMRR